MASSACYEDAVAFSTAQSSRPRPLIDGSRLAWAEDRRADAAAVLVPPLVYAARGADASTDATIRLLDEVRRVASVEAAAGRRIPPRTCHKLVDASLRIASATAARYDEARNRRDRYSYSGASADIRGPLRAFFVDPPLTHAVIEAVAVIGQGYQDFGPRSL